MADEEKTNRDPAEVAGRIWHLSEKIDLCMFTTWDGERQRSRPLAANVRRAEHAIYFLVDQDGDKNGEVEKFPFVSCAFADIANNKYVVISGKAELSNDRAKIKELWTDIDKAWWDDENDPAIRLLTLKPEDGELWDSPNRVVATASALFAAVTGAKPKFGDNVEVSL